MNPDEIVQTLLQEDDPPAARALIEASVHLGTRGKTYNASYVDPAGVPRWKSTKRSDREAALALARKWERKWRAAQKKSAKQPKTHLIPGGLTYHEIARRLGVSERTVRKDLRSALQKLRADPVLRELWREWIGKRLKESVLGIAVLCELTPGETEALLSLARAESVEQLAIINCMGDDLLKAQPKAHPSVKP